MLIFVKNNKWVEINKLRKSDKQGNEEKKIIIKKKV